MGGTSSQKSTSQLSPSHVPRAALPQADCSAGALSHRDYRYCAMGKQQQLPQCVLHHVIVPCGVLPFYRRFLESKALQVTYIGNEMSIVKTTHCKAPPEDG